MHTRVRDPRDETGLTLVELLVYSLLLGGVLAIVGTIMINTLTMEQAVRDSTETTSRAQVAATAIESGVRNATAVSLTEIGDDQLLQVRTAGSDPNSVTWFCQAWYFTATAGTLRSTSTASDSVAVVAPTGEPTDWTLLVSNVVAPSGKIFDDDSGLVTIDFQSTTEDFSPVVITTSVLPRAWSGVDASCF